MTRQDVQRIPALLEEARNRAAPKPAKAAAQTPPPAAVAPVLEESEPTQLSLF
jgi:hypothetical protein